MSIAALAVSILPLAAYIPVFLNITVVGIAQIVWAGANSVFGLVGLLLSLICVRNRESRSAMNVISLVISGFWLLLMAGIAALALLLHFLP